MTGLLVAVFWLACFAGLVVVLSRAARQPVDRGLAAVDEDLDERAASARLYPSRRLIDVSPIACPVDLEDAAA